MAEELFGVFEQCKGGAREYAIENALIFLAHDNSSSQLGGKNNKNKYGLSLFYAKERKQ